MFDQLPSLYLLPILLLLFLATPLYNLYFHPLHSYPGPLLYRALRLRWVLALQRGSLHQDLLHLHNLYGPVVRVAPNELSYIDARAWTDIYLNPRIQRAKVWFPKLGGQPFTIMGYDEDAHARYKRAFGSGFGEKAMEGHVRVIAAYVGLMVGKWKGLCASGGGAARVDLREWLDMVTFDVSGDLCFGSSFGSTEQGKAHPWVDISNTFGKGVALTASLNFYPGMLKLLKYAMPTKVRANYAYHRQLTEEKVEERLSLPTTRNDFVQSVLDWNTAKASRGGVSKPEILANMPIILFAGSHTTAAALGSTFFYLLRNRSWYGKVTEEIRRAFASEEDITDAATERLELLTATFSEGMRLGPPSVLGVPRCVGTGGEMICGKFVPAGTMVAVSQFPAFRSPSNFKDPDVFDPSRFIQPSEHTQQIFRPFLLGRHYCLGQKFAWAEMRLLVARLLYSFDISLDETDAGGADDWGTQRSFVFWETQRMRVKLKLVR